MSARRVDSRGAARAAVLIHLALAPFLVGGEPRYPDHSKLLVVRDAGGAERPVASASDWAERRAHIVLGMEDAMGPFREEGRPPTPAQVPLDLVIESEENLERVVRKRVTFVAEPDDRVPAYLLVPRGLATKAPAVLCLHQTTSIGKGEPAGVGGKPSLHYALHLAERGYVTLAPDYPNFGDHPFDTYGKGYRSGCMKAIRDNVRAIDLLQSLPEVDPERIGCMGHSLGGHNTLFTAVFDDRIRVLVSNCGFNAFEHYYGGDIKGWSSKTYMPKIPSYGGWRNMPFDFHEVVAALAPRPFLAIAPLHDANFEVKGVCEAIAAARGVYRLLEAENHLAAVHPDCEHDFPPASRERAYAWFDQWLRRSGEPHGPERVKPESK
jgi:dienelactone hydrolase